MRLEARLAERQCQIVPPRFTNPGRRQSNDGSTARLEEPDTRCRHYGSRSISEGSTRMAVEAGRQDATTAMTNVPAMTTSQVAGSKNVTPNCTEPRVRDSIQPAPMPTTTPMAETFNPSASTVRRMAEGAAPRADRMPYSRWRRLTTYARTP